MKRFLLSLIIILFAISYSFAQMQQTGIMPPLVSVTGTGEIKVQPDEIALTIGVDIRDKNLDEARKQSDAKVIALLNFLKKSGIDSKYIQTTNLSVYPNYVGEYSQTTPEFYMVQKSISVIIKQVSKFDELLTGIYKTGANRVEGIEYRTSELQKHREQARKLAVQAAKQKAASLTSELGAKMGRVYHIDESTSTGYPQPMFGRAASHKMMEASAADAGGPTISVGQITVSSSVNMSFIIE